MSPRRRSQAGAHPFWSIPLSTTSSESRCKGAGRLRGGLLRSRLLLGCREAVLEDAGSHQHGCRLCGWLHAEPHVRGGLQRSDRSHRDREGELRPCQDQLRKLLKIFFENHDPTQGMRQGNDIGTQYRSAIYTTSPEQRATAERVRDEFQAAFNRAGYGRITTDIAAAGDFYYAEDYHQQYLDKNPFGYCPVHATGVTCN